MLKVGLAYEGGLDKEAILILLRRIMDAKGFSYELVREVSPRTGIIGSLKLYLKIFFEFESLNIGLLITDQDVPKNVDDRRKKIKDIIKQMNPTYLNFCAVGVCDPHFEAWLIADHNNLKETFNLPASSSINTAGKSPKRLIEYLHEQMDVPKPTLHEIYATLATKNDLATIVEQCPDFRLFVDELTAAARQSLT